MKFYSYFRSSAAYRCRIAFNLKGISPDSAFIHLRKGEQRGADFRALNPLGLVPAVEEDGAVLTQSLAIIEWLDEIHPLPPLLPRDPWLRAQCRALALTVACDIHPLQNLRVLDYLRQSFGQDQAGVDRWCRTWIEAGLTAFEAQLQQLGTAGDFCFGDVPTLADLCLVPQLFSAQRFGADVRSLAAVQRIAAAAGAHPAFVAAHPASQPDAEP